MLLKNIHLNGGGWDEMLEKRVEKTTPYKIDYSFSHWSIKFSGYLMHFITFINVASQIYLCHWQAVYLIWYM